MCLTRLSVEHRQINFSSLRIRIKTKYLLPKATKRRFVVVNGSNKAHGGNGEETALKREFVEFGERADMHRVSEEIGFLGLSGVLEGVQRSFTK